MKRVRSFGGVLAFAGALSSAVEDATAAASQAGSSGAEAIQLEQVVVSAQRRVESLQTAPLSIEAFDSKKLETLGVHGLADLATAVPAMTIEPFPTNNAELRFFIRGIGLIDAQVTQDPSVGVYMDGVYIGRAAGLALDIADLARIEVLRGPQGTLYGRNATGGAINLITQRPSTGSFSTTDTLSFGSRSQLLGKGSVNLPLTDTLAMRASVLGSRRHGFVENSGPGGDFGNRRDFGARGEAYWAPLIWLSARYAFDYSNLHDYNSLYQAVLPSTHDHGLANLFKAYAQQATVYSDQRLDSLAASAPYAESRTRVAGHAATLDARTGELELKYLGAYRQLLDSTYADLGGGKGNPNYRLDTQSYAGPAADAANGGPTPLQIPTVFQQQWSHEINLAGKLFDGTFEFIVGGFYFHEWGGEDGRPLHHVLNSAIDPTQYQNLPVRLPPLPVPLADLVAPRLAVFWNYLYSIDNTANAVFGQASWSPEFFDRRLHFTAGLRQSWDRRVAVKDRVTSEWLEAQVNGSGRAFELPPQQGNDDFPNVRAAKSYRDFSPSFNLQYDLTKSATIYFSSNRAYKSGGYNLRDPQRSSASGAAADGTNYGVGFVDGFKPERVQSYELGLKSEWLGRRLRVNADVFRMDYRDQQINFLIAGTVSDSKTLNAGRSRIDGFELDLTALLARGLLFSGSYAWLNAKTLEVRDVNGSNAASRFPFVAAPRNSYNVALDWSFVQRDWGKLRAYLNWSYIGKRLGSHSLRDFDQGTVIPAYGVLGAQLGASGARIGERGALDLMLWGKNLLGRDYVISAIDNLPQADRAVLWGEPRAIGVNLIYRYY